MKPIYHFEYTETEEIFRDMYLMFYQSRSGYGYKLTIFFMGLLILFMQISPDPSVVTPEYVVKCAVLWALAFLLGYLGNKFIYTRFNQRSAEKSGREAYEERVRKKGDELKVVIDCYEDAFVVSFQELKEQHTYREISRLMETDRMFGTVVGGVRGQKKMVSFPKAALQDADIEEFRRFMTGKCVNVAGGFKELKA